LQNLDHTALDARIEVGALLRKDHVVHVLVVGPQMELGGLVLFEPLGKISDALLVRSLIFLVDGPFLDIVVKHLRLLAQQCQLQHPNLAHNRLVCVFVLQL
jgi:hypothetical protein